MYKRQILIEIAPDLVARCSGDLILSGLLENQEAAILAAFKEMRVVERQMEGEWVILRLQPING